jgi:hypothetical protein
MKWLFTLLPVLVGCHQPHPTPVAEPASPQTPRSTGEIDFANWPAATDGAFDVSPRVARACEVYAPPTIPSVWAQNGGEKRHGPHFQHRIVVRVNPDAIEAFKEVGTPLPVGTTVVKEKHTDIFAKEPAAEYGAMVKREPGYDPAHGDWEYVYVVLKPEKRVSRGRLESCVECHAHAKDQDHLFRTYLPGLRKVAVADW